MTQPLQFQMVTAILPGDVKLGEFSNDAVISEGGTRATCTVQFDGERWTFLDGSPTGLPKDVLSPKEWAEMTASGDDGGYGLVSLTPIQGVHRAAAMGMGV